MSSFELSACERKPGVITTVAPSGKMASFRIMLEGEIW